MKRNLLHILAALALFLPAYAFATVYNFHNVTLNGGLNYGQYPVDVTGTLSGRFTTSSDGSTITDWDVTAPDFQFASANREVDLLNPWVFFWYTAEVISPTHLLFSYYPSPGSQRQIDLLLNGPLASGVTINPASNYAYDYHLSHQIFVGSGSLVTPEPQMVACLLLGAGVLLVLKLRPTQTRAVHYLRRVG